jgi:hypothetical protein
MPFRRRRPAARFAHVEKTSSVLHKDAQFVYRLRDWERHPWLDHGFGTRQSKDWPPQPLVWLRQVHSDLCLLANGSAGCLGRGDAIISNTPGLYLSIRTADCIPILMVDERLRVIAAVHAGWRGTVQRIAAKTLEALALRFSSRPADLTVVIGPGICGKCYTVGPEVAARFRPWFPERTDLDRETTIDLAEANRRQLVEAGVTASRICLSGLCTSCRTEEFHSHRRSGGKPGRMISAIAVRVSS